MNFIGERTFNLGVEIRESQDSFGLGLIICAINGCVLFSQDWSQD